MLDAEDQEIDLSEMDDDDEMVTEDALAKYARQKAKEEAAKENNEK